MKVADVDPAATVTLAGTVAALVFELESDTVTPPVPAASVRLTVPVPVRPLIIVVGLTETLLRAAGGGLTVTPNVVVAPENEAVSVTGVAVLTLPAVTENVVEVEPCGTVTVAGTFAAAGDALIPIAAPPLSAADVSVTVQVEPTVGVNDVGVHTRLLRAGVCPMATVPPLAVVGMPAPVESADRALVNWTDADESVGDAAKVRVTEATTLFGIDEVFSPQTRHVAVPEPSVQESVLFEAPAPAVTDADAKSAVG